VTVKNLTMLDNILRAKTPELPYFLYEELTKYGIDLAADGKKYTYYPGTIPVMLVAHLDTVHSGPPQEMYYDKSQGCIWSPDGLGADDRAGVWGVMEIVRRGYRPHILFTDEEEVGGKGARQAVEEFTPDGVHCLIEMDRKGSDDCVFYSDDNKKWHKWVKKFGFTKQIGSFTDISVLMPAWKVSGVNLSIGYYAQHTKTERLLIHEAVDTIDKVCRMLDVAPKKPVVYVAEVSKWASTTYSHNWEKNEKTGTWDRVPSSYRTGGYPDGYGRHEDYYNGALTDYHERVLPEVYKRQGLAGPPETPVEVKGEETWRCERCRYWIPVTEEQEPSNGICRDCEGVCGECGMLLVDAEAYNAATTVLDEPDFCPHCGKLVNKGKETALDRLINEAMKEADELEKLGETRALSQKELDMIDAWGIGD
jgi:hypothetical protein